MFRIIHMVTRPFRAFVVWMSDRGSWLSIPFRDQYMILKSLDRVTEGRMSYEQAEAHLSAYAERREQR